jgi:hypothetical protein
MCEKDFYTKGDTYRIKIDDDGELISVFLDGQSMGTISLEHREDDADPRTYYDWFHITNLSLDACKRKGIGRECLKFHIDTFGLRLTAGESDGNRMEDGSHLTGDGAPFIRKMREEGIVQRSSYDEEEEDDSNHGFL